MDKRYKDVRQLFDFATALADEILKDHPEYSAQDVFTLAGEIAINNLEFSNEVTPIQAVQIDRKEVAFVLQDGESIVKVGGEGDENDGADGIIWELEDD